MQRVLNWAIERGKYVRYATGSCRFFGSSLYLGTGRTKDASKHYLLKGEKEI